MEKVKVVLMEYHPEQKIELLETDVRKYPYVVPTNGYKEKWKIGDWLVLRKKEMVSVTIKRERDTGTSVFDTKDLICNFYKSDEMSKELFNRFCEDVRNEKIELYLNDENKLVIR